MTNEIDCEIKGVYKIKDFDMFISKLPVVILKEDNCPISVDYFHEIVEGIYKDEYYDMSESEFIDFVTKNPSEFFNAASENQECGATVKFLIVEQNFQKTLTGDFKQIVFDLMWSMDKNSESYILSKYYEDAEFDLEKDFGYTYFTWNNWHILVSGIPA